MTEAIFGLVGVVVGGVLTGGIDYVAKAREERAVMRSLARSIFAALTDLRSLCEYCTERETWVLFVEPPKNLREPWKEHELVLGRLLRWDEWTGLQAVRTSQFGLGLLAGRAQQQPSLEQTHLPSVTQAAIAAIDSVLPSIERRAKR